MTDKEMVGVRLPKDTHRQIEQYADEHDLSKSDALRRMIEKGVELESAGLAVAAATQTENSDDDPETLADGSGAVVRPFLRIVTGLSAFSVLISFLYGLVVASTGIPAIVDMADTLGIIVATSVTLVLFLLPQYTKLPEKVDSHLWSSARTIAPSVTEP